MMRTQDELESTFPNSNNPTTKGRTLIYHETHPATNRFKYVGSGDLTFISMRVKEGKYLVILEFSKNTL